MWGQNANAMNSGAQCNTFMRPMTSEMSMLSPGLWNQNFSIRIRPAIGKDGNGVTQYDKNRQGQTALSQENCYALATKFDELIRPKYEAAIKDGLPCDVTSVSVMSGGVNKNVTTIYMRPSNDPEDQTPVMSLEIAIGVDANGVAAEGNVYKHEFSKKTVLVGYSASTGPKGKSSVNADFEYFMSIVYAMAGSKNSENLVANHLEKYESMRSTQSTGSSSSDHGSFGGGGFNKPQGNSAQQSGGGFGLPFGDEMPF